MYMVIGVVKEGCIELCEYVIRDLFYFQGQTGFLDRVVFQLRFKGWAGVKKGKDLRGYEKRGEDRVDSFLDRENICVTIIMFRYFCWFFLRVIIEELGDFQIKLYYENELELYQ